MGGGKTHNLLALGLLARHPEFRDKVMGGFHKSDPALGSVKVVAFTGREVRRPARRLGALAEQLGKRNTSKTATPPASAGPESLGEPLRRPDRAGSARRATPYFENARSKAIGNSDLAQVTATALSNLLVAIGRPACSRVCLVISDLTATYQKGTAYISTALKTLKRRRIAGQWSSSPCGSIPTSCTTSSAPASSKHCLPIARSTKSQAYAKAIRAAKQMQITSESPEEYANRILSSYPFHPGVRDLYARFRENPGFQQTRGLIRLMRIVAARLWKTGEAKSSLLIAAHDLDLNDQETR